jgi:hypothetical protein
MTDESMMGRVGRVEVGLATLSTEFAGVKVQLEGQGKDLSIIAASVAGLGDKLDRSRPGIGAIWVPLGVVFAAMSLIGSAIVVPQLARVSVIEADRRDEIKTLTRMQIDAAILCDRSSRKCPEAP